VRVPADVNNVYDFFLCLLRAHPLLILFVSPVVLVFCYPSIWPLAVALPVRDLTFEWLGLFIGIFPISHALLSGSSVLGVPAVPAFLGGAETALGDARGVHSSHAQQQSAMWVSTKDMYACST
jgi:hypothetical protein